MNHELRVELEEMAAEDRRCAHLANSAEVGERLAWREVSARHGDRLREILVEFGWPRVDLVGLEAARAAWLLAQHADRQLDVQRLALRLMEQAVAEGEPSPPQLAMLRDRVLVNSGQPQLYGTQIAEVRDGLPVPWPVREPDRMDALRAEMGLESFAAHTARFAPGKSASLRRPARPALT